MSGRPAEWRHFEDLLGKSCSELDLHAAIGFELISIEQCICFPIYHLGTHFRHSICKPPIPFARQSLYDLRKIAQRADPSLHWRALLLRLHDLP